MKVILIDDEELSLRYLEYLLITIGEFEIVGKYTDPFKGRQAVQEHDIDIVFLDIHIPEWNGIELAETLLEKKPELNVVFITSYEEYAIKAFELNALDYLLKPIQLERLKLTVQRIQQRRTVSTGTTAALSSNWRIQLFGEFMILNDRRENKPLQWRTSKAQELFFYLLHHRGKIISKSILIELLWSDFELQKALSQLYTAIYHIRKTLERLKGRILLQNTADGYILRLENMELDVDELERFLHTDSLLANDTVSEYGRILKLIEGEYLEGFNFDWVEYERQRYQLQWIRLKMEMVNWFYEQQEFEKAFKHCDQICTRFPMEEQAQLMYLKICDKRGYHFLVQRQYQLYDHLMDRENNERPGSEISKWYEHWEKKQMKE